MLCLGGIKCILRKQLSRNRQAQVLLFWTWLCFTGIICPQGNRFVLGIWHLQPLLLNGKLPLLSHPTMKFKIFRSWSSEHEVWMSVFTEMWACTSLGICITHMCSVNPCINADPVCMHEDIHLCRCRPSSFSFRFTGCFIFFRARFYHLLSS